MSNLYYCRSRLEGHIEKVEKKLEVMPLSMGGFVVGRKEQDKYLGQVLHQGGLAMSVKATIQERAGRIKGAIYKAKQVIETVQMQAIGGMMAAKQLWEGAIVPSLLSGAGTWVGLDLVHIMDMVEFFKGILKKKAKKRREVPL